MEQGAQPPLPPPNGTIAWFGNAFAYNGWQNTLATDEQVSQILDWVETGLKEGGIGINGGYAPGYGRKEYYALAQLAARYQVPTFTHVRYVSVIEPNSAFAAADVVLLNKIDLVSRADCAAVSNWVRRLSPSARVLETVQAQVPLELPLGVGAVSAQPASHCELPHDGHEHCDHHHRLQFDTWSFESGEPLALTRLSKVISQLPPSIFRVKGVLHLQ